MKLLASTFLLTILLLIFAPLTPLHARETRSQRILRTEISYMIARTKTPRTLKAIDIYSRKYQRTIYSSYSGLLLHPASNLKIVTTSFALHCLGSDYRFATPFELAGVQRSDSLIGDLVVVGKGDPILDTDDLDSAAGAISKTGIRVITGDLVIDISRFDSLQWGAGWMWDDEPEPYAMFISPASLDHDVVVVIVSLDSSGRTLDVSTEPQTGFIRVENDAVQGETDTIRVTREMIHGVNTIVVTGTYTGAFLPETYEFSVRHPAHYFGTVLRELLNKYGVTVGGSLVVTRDFTDHLPRVQAYTLTHSIDTVITYTNKVSDNLGAECLLREVPPSIYQEVGSAKNGITLEKDFLELCGVDSAQYHIVDGSGVSHYDLITPNAIVRVLRFDLDQPYKDIFLHSLPIAGEDGTLEDRMTNDCVKGRVLAKTGSIEGVRTLSGYVLIPDDTLVFSMMMQNFAANGDSMDALQDSICSVLAQYDANSRIFTRNLRKFRIGTYGIVRYRKSSPVPHLKRERVAPNGVTHSKNETRLPANKH